VTLGTGNAARTSPPLLFKALEFERYLQDREKRFSQERLLPDVHFGCNLDPIDRRQGSIEVGDEIAGERFRNSSGLRKKARDLDEDGRPF